MRTTTEQRGRPVLRALRGLALGALPLVLLGCERLVTVGPEDPPAFLAVVTSAEGPEEIDRGVWTMRIAELSGSLGFDRLIPVVPGDTVIISPPSATYRITLEDIPVACSSRTGLARQSVVGPPGSTSTVRFNLACRPLLSLVTGTDGVPQGDFVYRVDGPEGLLRTGPVGPNDTIRFDGLVPGEYRVDLSLLDPRCVVWSDGFRRQTITAAPFPNNRIANFRVTCSVPEFAPRLEHVGASAKQGVVSFYFEATDPGNGRTAFPDIDRYWWDVTDCRGNRVRGGNPFSFGGLSAFTTRTARQDTVRVALAFPLDLSDEQIDGSCLALRVLDFDGNSTPVFEEPLAPGPGVPPRVFEFDIRIGETLDGPAFFFDVEAGDREDDLAANFVSFVVADGTLGADDGRPEVWFPNVVGGLGPSPDSIRLATLPFGVDDIERIVVRFIDREGNFTTMEDDVFTPGSQ